MTRFRQPAHPEAGELTTPTDHDPLLITRVPETLRQQVVDRLRTAICEGRFAPGARLVERQLCDLVGVSRPLVREALRQLEAEGFVAGNPRTGPTVARLDRSTVRSIYEVRAALEALAGKLFVERASEEHKATLRRAYADYRAASRDDKPTGALQATEKLYEAIFIGAQNETIAAVLRPLSGRITLLRARSLSVKGRRSMAREEMKAIYNALLGDDPEEAWECCWQHVVNALEYVMQSIEYQEV